MLLHAFDLSPVVLKALLCRCVDNAASGQGKTDHLIVQTAHYDAHGRPDMKTREPLLIDCGHIEIGPDGNNALIIQGEATIAGRPRAVRLSYRLAEEAGQISY